VDEHSVGQMKSKLVSRTDPVPPPATCTVSVYWTGGGVTANVAVTFSSEFIVTMHDCVPEQPAPLQPMNVEPLSGEATSSTWDPWSKACEQSVGHRKSKLVSRTDPVPPPASVTVRVNCVWAIAGPGNASHADRSASAVTARTALTRWPATSMRPRR
jgi:hypothetical protein